MSYQEKWGFRPFAFLCSVEMTMGREETIAKDSTSLPPKQVLLFPHCNSNAASIPFWLVMPQRSCITKAKQKQFLHIWTKRNVSSHPKSPKQLKQQSRVSRTHDGWSLQSRQGFQEQQCPISLGDLVQQLCQPQKQQCVMTCKTIGLSPLHLWCGWC